MPSINFNIPSSLSLQGVFTIQGGLSRPALADSLIQVLGASAAQTKIVIETEANQGQFVLRRANAGGTAIANGDGLGVYAFRGMGTSLFSGSRAYMQATALENWTDTQQGLMLEFFVTAITTVVTASAMQLRNTGLTISGQLATAASTTALSSLNLPHGAAPTSPVNGDMWTTTAGLFVRINSGTVGPLGTGGGSGTPANPTASVGLTAVNGSLTTYMRSDAAPPLDVSINPTWTGTHIFNNTVTAPTIASASGTLTLSPFNGVVTIASASAFLPQIQVTCTNSSANSQYLIFSRNRSGAASQANDYIGTVLFQGTDSSGTPTLRNSVDISGRSLTVGTGYIQGRLTVATMDTAGATGVRFQVDNLDCTTNVVTSITKQIGGVTIASITSAGLAVTGIITASSDIKSQYLTSRLNCFEEYLTNATAALAINYNGYNGGTTQFRELRIYDGKNSQVGLFDTTGLAITGVLTTTGNITLTKAAGSFTLASSAGRPTIVNRSNGTAASNTDTPVFQFNRNTNAMPSAGTVGEIRYDGLNTGSTYTLYGMITVVTTSVASATGSSAVMNFTIADGTTTQAPFQIGPTVIAISATTSASSSIAGAFTVGNGSASTSVAIGGGKINAGGTIDAAGTITGAGTIRASDGTRTVSILQDGSACYVGTQSAHNLVVIRGGSQVGLFTSTGLDSCAIGATTPLSGAFTALSSTGNTTLGSASSLLAIGTSVASGCGLTVNQNVASFSGVAIGVNFSSVMLPGANGETTNALNISGNINKSTYTGLTTYIFSILNGTISGAGTISNRVGLSINSITGGTTNYAIVTSGGIVSFGDSTDSTAYNVGGVLVGGGLGVTKAATFNAAINWKTAIISGTTVLDGTYNAIVATGVLPYTVTLPNATVQSGRVYWIKNKVNGILTIDGTSLGQIDGVNTLTLSQYQSVILISDGTNWNIW